MGIPMSGQTSDPEGGKGTPYTYYEYHVETWGRTSSSVHVRLSLYLWMGTYSSYYSFRIAHETMANGVYQYSDIKTTRRFWGHERSVGTSYFDVDDFWFASWDDWYDGTFRHGPFVVFDGDVPMGLDDEVLDIIPCITQPPITNIGDGIYAWNSQDHTGWRGEPGYWRPFGPDEQWGSYAWEPNSWSGCFLNNRYCQPLEGDGIDIGRYPRPAACRNLVLSPSRVDVRGQDSTPLVARWDAAARAARYAVRLERLPKGATEWILDDWQYVRDAQVSMLPKSRLSTKEILDGDRYRVTVQSVDSSGVWSAESTTSGVTTYYEVASHAPTNAYLVGRRGERNEIIYKGESARLWFDGWFDGSYPIAKLSLTRQDGVSTDILPSSISNTTHHEESPKTLDIPPYHPNRKVTFELRAWNTMGRPVYVDGDMSAKRWYSFEVDYYGAVASVWTGSSWREGVVWVWDGTEWHEGSELFMWDGSQWKGQ